jgi:tetratricopeptide repeat protein 7
MSVIMLCTCSGDQSRFEDISRSPECLATRDFSANGSSSKTASRETMPDDSQVNEVESDLREALSLNYEVCCTPSIREEIWLSCVSYIC